MQNKVRQTTSRGSRVRVFQGEGLSRKTKMRGASKIGKQGTRFPQVSTVSQKNEAGLEKVAVKLVLDFKRRGSLKR